MCLKKKFNDDDKKNYLYFRLFVSNQNIILNILKLFRIPGFSGFLFKIPSFSRLKEIFQIPGFLGI